MILQNLLKFFILFLLFLCKAVIAKAQTADKFDGYPLLKEGLNKRNWTPAKSYYLMTKASDSTVHLYWGNDGLKRKYNADLDLRSAEKIHVQWANENYLILQYGTGSGVWVNIALPLDKEAKTHKFCNGIYFDEIDNLIVSEGYGDTILIAQNLKTGRKQFIIDKKHCCTVYNSACVDEVTIKNKVLYVTWAPDNCSDGKKKTYTKKVKLQL